MWGRVVCKFRVWILQCVCRHSIMLFLRIFVPFEVTRDISVSTLKKICFREKLLTLVMSSAISVSPFRGTTICKFHFVNFFYFHFQLVHVLTKFTNGSPQRRQKDECRTQNRKKPELNKAEGKSPNDYISISGTRPYLKKNNNRIHLN
jgi:hypothetical protein